MNIFFTPHELVRLLFVVTTIFYCFFISNNAHWVINVSVGIATSLVADKLNVLLEIPRLRVPLLAIVVVFAVAVYKLWGKNPRDEFSTWLTNTREKNAETAQKIEAEIERLTSGKEATKKEL